MTPSSGGLGNWGIGVSKKPGDGGGASVCRRRLGAREFSREALNGIMVEVLFLVSESRRCLLNEPIRRRLCPSLRGIGFGGVALWSNESCEGEGVNGGPCSGTGTR